MRLREFYRILKDRRDVRRRLLNRPKLTPDGFPFSGRRLFFSDQWERKERQFLSRVLPRMDLFINFGANHGYYCCLALKFGVRTIAFEPVPDHCAVIARNIRLNKWSTNFSLFPVAVSNRTGLAEIYGLSRTDTSLLRGFATTSHLRTQIVPVHKIDDLIPARVLQSGNSLVLMDIEGSETDALEGAKSLLDASPQPVWIIEIFPGQGHETRERARRAFEIMIDAGYTAYALNEDSGLDRISQFTSASLASRDNLDGKKPFSGGNAVFLPNGFRY